MQYYSNIIYNNNNIQGANVCTASRGESPKGAGFWQQPVAAASDPGNKAQEPQRWVRIEDAEEIKNNLIKYMYAILFIYFNPISYVNYNEASINLSILKCQLSSKHFDPYENMTQVK